MGLNRVVVNQHQSVVGIVSHCPPSLHWEDQHSFDFCQANKELRIERTAQGDWELCHIQVEKQVGGIWCWPLNSIFGRRKMIVALRMIYRQAITLPNETIHSPVKRCL